MGSTTPPTVPIEGKSSPIPMSGEEKHVPVTGQDSQATLPQFPSAARIDSREVTTSVARGIGQSEATLAQARPDSAHFNGADSAHLNGTTGPRARPGRGPAHSPAASSPPPLPTNHTDSDPKHPPKPEPLSLTERIHSYFHVNRDLRSYLPRIISRFLGWRGVGAKAPFDPLPFPPFSWLRHIPLKYEVWILSTIGAFVGIALIEIVMATAFAGAPHGSGIVLIVASFGASAVLTYGALDAPLAQPRNLVGGQVLCSIIGVAITRLFRHAHAYELHDTTQVGDLGHVVWLNGALAMALALLAMLVTDTVHPPAGATALIAAVQPTVVAMSWRYVYIVLISSLLMMGWGMVINNVGRRRYPTYWISGKRIYVHPPPPEPDMAAEEGRHRVTSSLRRLKSRTRSVTQNEMMMEALEGRNPGFEIMSQELARSRSPDSTGSGRSRRKSITENEMMMEAFEGRNDGFERMSRELARTRSAASVTSRTSRAGERVHHGPPHPHAGLHAARHDSGVEHAVQHDPHAASGESGWNEKDHKAPSAAHAHWDKNV